MLLMKNKTMKKNWINNKMLCIIQGYRISRKINKLDFY